MGHHSCSGYSRPLASGCGTVQSGPIISPVELTYTATLTLPTDEAPTFHFKNYVNPTAFNRGDTSIRTSDYTVERKDNGTSYTYRIRASSPFHVIHRESVLKVDTKGEVDLTPGESALNLPPALASFDQKAWDTFATRIIPARAHASSDGNAVLAEKIDRQLLALRGVLETGVTQSNLMDYLQARDSLNQSLRLAAIGIQETCVSAPGWNLRKTGYRFTLPAEDVGAAPRLEVTLRGSTNQTLPGFMDPPHADSENRKWAIADGNAVLFSRKRLQDGAYEFWIYISESFAGTINLVPQSRGENVTITAVKSSNSGTSLAATYNPIELYPYGNRSLVESKREVLSVPDSFAHLLPPLVNQEWKRFSQERETFTTCIANTNPELAKEIDDAARSYEWFAFETTDYDSAQVGAARATLEQLMEQAQVPGTTKPVFTGSYRRVGSHLQPIYRYHTTPALAPPPVPPVGPPRLLAPLPRETKGLGEEYAFLSQVYDHARPPIGMVESSTRLGTFFREGGSTEYRFAVTKLCGNNEGAFILEFEVSGEGRPRERAMARYEIGAGGEFLSPPTIRPSDEDYPGGAIALKLPRDYYAKFGNTAHQCFVGNSLRLILNSLAPPRRD